MCAQAKLPDVWSWILSRCDVSPENVLRELVPRIEACFLSADSTVRIPWPLGTLSVVLCLDRASTVRT